METKKGIINESVEDTMLELEQHAPDEYKAVMNDPALEDYIREAAKRAAIEEVKLADEFAIRPDQDIRKRFEKYLPEDGIKLIEEALTIPTFSMEIIENSPGKYLAQITSEGEEFLPEIELKTLDDINWAKILQYASIVIEAVMLAMQAAGIKASVSRSTMKATIKETAQTIKKASEFRRAIQAFTNSWRKTGSKYGRAKAIVTLLNETKAAGILWTIIKSLFRNMSWWGWLKTAATVSAMLIASLASGGAALVAKIVLALFAAAALVQKIANVVKLEEIEESMKKTTRIELGEESLLRQLAMNQPDFPPQPPRLLTQGVRQKHK